MDETTRIALKLLRSFEMTESEWKEYHKEHPHALKENHTIISDPKVQNSKEIHQARRKAKAEYFKEMKRLHPNYIPITKKHEIEHVIQHGTYSVISAGVNTKDAKDIENAKKDPNFIKNRTKALMTDLDKLGVRYTEVAGKYDDEEVSFLITHDLDAKASEKEAEKPSLMINNYNGHADIIKKLNKLGEKYNQDSVAHSKNGRMEWHYTTGKRKGKRCAGEGTDFVPISQDDSYSEARIGKRSYTKWVANMDRCLEDNKGHVDENNFIENPYKP